MITLEPSILLVTGIMASGKSTVAQTLAEQLDPSVHLRGDVFRRMIVNGRVEVEPDAEQAALDQLALRYTLAATAAKLYCEGGFTVVYQDIIIGPMLQEVVDGLRGQWPLYVIVLTPSAEVVAQREAARGKTGYGAWTPEAMDHLLRTETPGLGLWLDTSALSAAETADTILRSLDAARVSAGSS